jgi:predicted O-methyltransferase YrrM
MSGVDAGREERVDEVIGRLIRSGAAVAREDGSTHTRFPVAISEAEIASLRGWAEREGRSSTIEIGFGYGLSALAICAGVLRGHREPAHLVIDPYQESRFANCGLQFLEDAGLIENVEHLSLRSEIVLPQLLDAGRSFDFAFVDGNHRFDGVFLDLFYVGRMIGPGGVIFVDDYQLPGVAKAVGFFVSNLGWRVEEESAPDDFHRWAVVRTSREADTRRFDDFVAF